LVAADQALSEVAALEGLKVIIPASATSLAAGGMIVA